MTVWANSANSADFGTFLPNYLYWKLLKLRKVVGCRHSAWQSRWVYHFMNKYVKWAYYFCDNGRSISKCGLIKHTCLWCDELIILSTLNRQNKIFLCMEIFLVTKKSTCWKFDSFVFWFSGSTWQGIFNHF